MKEVKDSVYVKTEKKEEYYIFIGTIPTLNAR